MKKLLLFVLAASLTAFAQGKSGGSRPAGPPAGSGPGSTGMGAPQRPDMTERGRPDATGKPADHMDKRSDHTKSQAQKPLSDKHTNSGSFKMLQEKTGKSAEELKAMYEASGAKNYGQFVSAVIVSKNLGLDTGAVLSGLKDKSLGQTLQDLGVSEARANAEIKKAEAEAKAGKRKNR